MSIKESLQSFKTYLEHYEYLLDLNYKKRDVLGSPSDTMTAQEFYQVNYINTCKMYKINVNF